ncbi:MAG: adenylate/guanylate cyclase domain-containing protein [Burkholderiaceae bacterium]
MNVQKKTLPPVRGTIMIGQNRQFRKVFLFFGTLMVALVAVLAVQALRSVSNDRAAILENARSQGYWVARSLELGHGGMREEKNDSTRDLVTELVRHEEIVSLTLVKEDRTVLVASDASLEGKPWGDALGAAEERGRVVRSDLRTTEIAYAANFAELLARMGRTGAHNHKSVNQVKWVVITLNTAEAYAHYRSGVTQSILMLLLAASLAVAAVAVLGVIRRNLRLEQIKRGLQRFVPQSVRKRIEDDPENHQFKKHSHNASVLFLDIEGYTRLSEDTPPEVLNHLVEKYFSAFLDTILLYDGEINETAGDGIMAIFGAKMPHDHARSAVKAAIEIRERARTMNLFRAPKEPEILVNAGINTGEVLIGATTFKGATGEHRTYTASGTVTNIAARLSDLGVNGEICTTAATAELVKADFALSGPVQTDFKNVGYRVPVYRVK